MADTHTEETVNLTADGARKFLKRQPTGTIFAVMLSFDSPIENEPGRVFPGGCMTGLTLPKKQALKLPGALLTKTLEDRGGRIRLKVLVWPTDSNRRDKEARWVYIGG